MDTIRSVGIFNVITNAMNQAFFTLSLGIAAMEIFGSYMHDDHTLTGEAVRICALDTFVAIMAGLIIFPACFSYNVELDHGPALIFMTLPKIFLDMPGGRVWGSLFFLFMTFASFSTVTAVFSAHGVPLADADQLSREILLPSSPLLPVLAERFGEEILRPDGSLDRRLLADRAFATPEGKAALDLITHPEIVRRIRLAKQAAQEAGAPLFVLDGAVIVGTAAEAECDRLAVVTAPFETSVARIAQRDGIAPDMAARRLNAQTPESVLLARADYVLRNDADLAALEAAASALCEQLLAEGRRKGGAEASV